jgi:hypothetical protein
MFIGVPWTVGLGGIGPSSASPGSRFDDDELVRRAGWPDDRVRAERRHFARDRGIA